MPSFVKITMDAERVTAVTDAWLKLMEIPSADVVIGLPWWYLLPPALVPTAITEWNACTRARPQLCHHLRGFRSGTRVCRRPQDELHASITATFRHTWVRLLSNFCSRYIGSGTLIRTVARHDVDLTDDKRVKGMTYFALLLLSGAHARLLRFTNRSARCGLRPGLYCSPRHAVDLLWCAH